MATQKGWKVDSNACISCRACEMACKVEYGLHAGQGRRRRVIEKTVVESGVVRTFFISLACNHCENPACVAACPKSKTGTFAGDALYKDTSGAETSAATAGVVLVNPNNCIGCRACEWACPYGAPQYNPTTGKIHKCEMCWQRVANTDLHSSRQVPACQATCLGQSIKLADVDTNPAATTLSTVDDLGAAVTYPDTPFAAPGATGVSSSDRGTQYIADASLTKPALKIRNRVYVKRDGSGVE